MREASFYHQENKTSTSSAQALVPNWAAANCVSVDHLAILDSFPTKGELDEESMNGANNDEISSDEPEPESSELSKSAALSTSGESMRVGKMALFCSSLAPSSQNLVMGSTAGEVSVGEEAEDEEEASRMRLGSRRGFGENEPRSWSKDEDSEDSANNGFETAANDCTSSRIGATWR